MELLEQEPQPQGFLERVRAVAAWYLHIGMHEAPDYVSGHYTAPENGDSEEPVE